MLYQLSYTHQKNPAMLRKPFAVVKLKMARQEGFEPSAYGLEVRCSIQLSYWRITAINLTIYAEGCVSSMRFKDLQTNFGGKNCPLFLQAIQVAPTMVDRQQKRHKEDQLAQQPLSQPPQTIWGHHQMDQR